MLSIGGEGVYTAASWRKENYIPRQTAMYVTDLTDIAYFWT